MRHSHEPLQGECFGSRHKPIHGLSSVDGQDMRKGMVSPLVKLHHEQQLKSRYTSELSQHPPWDWSSSLHSEYFAARCIAFRLAQSILSRQGGEGSGAVRHLESG
jgi:hypothetical protein